MNSDISGRDVPPADPPSPDPDPQLLAELKAQILSAYQSGHWREMLELIEKYERLKNQPPGAHS